MKLWLCQEPFGLHNEYDTYSNSVKLYNFADYTYHWSYLHFDGRTFTWSKISTTVEDRCIDKDSGRHTETHAQFQQFSVHSSE